MTDTDIDTTHPVDQPVAPDLPGTSVWPDWMPFGKTWEPIFQLLLEVAVLLVFLLMIVSIFLKISKIVQRHRYNKALDAESDALADSLVRELSVRRGVDESRRILLNNIRGQWGRTKDLLSRSVDEDVVAETVDHLIGDWTPHRVREFCLRYNHQLNVILSSRILDTFDTAGLSYSDGRAVRYPKLVGLGEDNWGLYAIYRSNEKFLLEDWEQELPVFALVLDAPAIEVHEIDGGLFKLALRDVARRAEPTEEPPYEPPVDTSRKARREAKKEDKALLKEAAKQAADKAAKDKEDARVAAEQERKEAKESARHAKIAAKAERKSAKHSKTNTADTVESSPEDETTVLPKVDENLTFEEALGKFNELHGYGKKGMDVEFDRAEVSEFVKEFLTTDGSVGQVSDIATEYGFDLDTPISSDNITNGDLLISEYGWMAVYVGEGKALTSDGRLADADTESEVFRIGK